MDNGIYVTLSRQLALFRDMDVTANNIANSTTTGYNADHVMFESYLFKDMSQGKPSTVAMANNVRDYRNLEAGPIKVTNNPLDLVVQNGYFMVDTPLGQRYTRSGNFTLSNAGELVTMEGYPVLSNAGQPITFPEDTQTIDIGSIGNIKVNGDDFGTLGIARFSNEQLLERAGNNLFVSNVAPEVADETLLVVQGALEGSNVQPIQEMTHMMEVSRGVSNTAKYVEVVYDLQRKAATAWTQQG
ncbi:MAG: flagellar hook-basal body complex protein [Rickettsiales bacterium]|nr:flagellar hook-basal body complex protein [Rickettsiales bacterium]